MAVRRPAEQMHAHGVSLPHGLPMVLNVPLVQAARAVSAPPPLSPSPHLTHCDQLRVGWLHDVPSRRHEIRRVRFPAECVEFQTFTHTITCHSFSMVSNWVEGGYSDDMIVGAVCERHGRGIGWAPDLLFPSRCR